MLFASRVHFGSLRGLVARRTQRRGAAAILIVSMLMVFLVMAAVTIDYAYMQSVRADLRIATDASAKAGAEALARTESESKAIKAAVDVAAANTVAGSGLSISNSDVILGRVTAGSGGKYTFAPGQKPYNSVQVNSKVKSSLFFGKALEREFFEPKHEAVAGYQEYDVVLCLDRSGSMLFDMSGTDYEYPPNNPNLSKFTAWGVIWQNHLSPPHPTDSRWAVLNRAVNDFLTVAGESSPEPYVGLVTWASDYTMPITPYTKYDASTLNVGLPSTSNYQAQVSTISADNKNLGKKPMMGGTNLSAGLDEAISLLKSKKARSLSNKTILLFTDGEWNEGRDPLLSAADAAKAGITIHTVSMLTKTQTVLSSIAGATGGKSYTTANEAQLIAAFREIAKGLQVVMVE